jgi:tRNA(fMet)-specific endonuclease VapC
MRYLLDTNTCIVHLRSGGTHSISKRLLATPNADLAIPTIVEAELLYGALHSASAIRGLSQTRTFCSSLTRLPFDIPAAQAHAQIREQLAQVGTPIGPYDMIIAATAIVHDLIVVTHNVREFSRVSGLRWEDWEIP